MRLPLHVFKERWAACSSLEIGSCMKARYKAFQKSPDPWSPLVERMLLKTLCSRRDMAAIFALLVSFGAKAEAEVARE